ncbi:MAG TPA: helix-turn-helix domain-containing protein [Xanthobacteraceae bacterium]|jgi:hypothetical protein|nr:helix-turn-helix domain-containing protein [Xanthobacteraceae bacterium]
MRRIPTLLEVERSHVLNTLHLCGNNRTLTAKMLGLSVRGLRMKLHQYQKAGFATAVAPACNEICGEVNAGGALEGRALPENEIATLNVIEELISVVEAIRVHAQPSAAQGRQRPRRKKRP